MNAIDPIFDSLNEPQRAAVAQIEGPLLILAGPGSGKTRVITHRIANMIAHDVPSHSIVAMTFTNKAADEMRSRLEKLAPGNQAWTGTFHRFCSRLLRNYASLVGLSQNFTIYDSGDSKKVIKQAIENTKIELRHYNVARLSAEISNVKNAGITVEDFQPRPGHVLDKIVSQVYPEYQKLLRLSNGVDFDDLLLHAVALLRQSPELRESLDQRYAYMMVDEYQDTNLTQYQLIRLLNHSQRNLAVTGDPDQSIYGWRGANLNNILEFERDYPNLNVVRLEQNYRSTKAVLAVADQLIANNVRRKPKTLHTENQAGNPVRLVTYRNPEDEAADIANTVALAITRGEKSASDFAVLYRTNYLSRSLEHAFRRANVPYQIVRGHEFYQRAEIKEVIGYLHLLNNPADGVALERVINVPPRKIGKATLGKIRSFALEHEISMLDAARAADQIPAISAAPAKKILKFVEMMDRLSTAATDDVEVIIKAVLEETGYRDWLTADGSEEGFERASNIDELMVAAAEFDRDFGDAQDDGGLEKYLEQAALVSDVDAWESTANYVTLMTLHAAKGLEFPAVFIVGLEEGILPHERSATDPEQVEEERRLLFVGITRAESDLQISRCLNRFRRGSHWPVIPSRFLMELPRSEMDVFEPRTHDPFDNQSASDSFDGIDIDPWLHDGLPEIDINATTADRIRLLDDDDYDYHLPNRKSNSLKNLKVLSDADSVDPDFDDGDPSSGNSFVKETRSAAFPRLMTAAQFAEQDASTGVRLHPSSFEVGMNVDHLEYGIGTVIDLSGEGQKRTATIDFQDLGKKRIRVAYCNLRAVN